MELKRELRWGILGCARISRRGLIPGIKAALGNSLEALASRDRLTAEAWAREFRIPKAYGSYEELLRDPEIDCVYIPLPNELHEQWVIAAADAGKHILCEKPLARNSEEAVRMVEHCRERGVLLIEAFMWRSQSRIAAIRKFIDSGAIGDLILVRGSFSFVIDLDDWRLDPERGGGALLDVGCYVVNAARLFIGTEPEIIRSQARLHETGVDLSLTSLLEFPGGELACVDCSFEQPYRCELELVGSAGRIEIPHAFLPQYRPTAQCFDAAGKKLKTPFLGPRGENQYAKMVEHFASGVRSGSIEPADPAEDGLAQMIALDLVLEALSDD